LRFRKTIRPKLSRGGGHGESLAFDALSHIVAALQPFSLAKLLRLTLGLEFDELPPH
jgi:hypothetical protein